MSEDRELRLKRLRLMASQRGLLEAELALRAFVDRHLAGLSPAQLDHFERLLGLADLDLWEMLCGRRPPLEGMEPGLLDMLRRPITARPRG